MTPSLKALAKYSNSAVKVGKAIHKADQFHKDFSTSIPVTIDKVSVVYGNFNPTGAPAGDVSLPSPDPSAVQLLSAAGDYSAPQTLTALADKEIHYVVTRSDVRSDGSFAVSVAFTFEGYDHFHVTIDCVKRISASSSTQVKLNNGGIPSPSLCNTPCGVVQVSLSCPETSGDHSFLNMGIDVVDGMLRPGEQYDFATRKYLVAEIKLVQGEGISSTLSKVCLESHRTT